MKKSRGGWRNGSACLSYFGHRLRFCVATVEIWIQDKVEGSSPLLLAFLDWNDPWMI